MSRPIQALAPGFLGLLGLKNQGQLPPEMIDAVQPVFNIEQYYLLGLRDIIPFSGVAVQNVLAVANYAFPELTVPSNEVWYVHGFTVDVPVPAATTWEGAACHFTRNFTPVRTSERLQLAAGATGRITLSGFYALPGDLLGLLTGFTTGAGAINADASLVLSRFTV